jgi:hypothetical protein
MLIKPVTWRLLAWGDLFEENGPARSTSASTLLVI